MITKPIYIVEDTLIVGFTNAFLALLESNGKALYRCEGSKDTYFIGENHLREHYENSGNIYWRVPAKLKNK